jgi:hypothetical protein
MMGKGKRTPERSQIVRPQTAAFSRKQRGDKDDKDDKPEESKSPDEVTTQTTLTDLKAQGTDLPAIEPPDPKAEPWPDATPPPMAPVAAGAEVKAPYGGPPEMPTTTAPPPLMLGNVENPAHMPGPKDIPGGNPEDPAPAPGSVPRGDSRSLRRGNEFALVYRVGTCVITRTGTVGTRGQWRVVEYPTSASAANSYAKEASRFVSEGFSDYRE